MVWEIKLWFQIKTKPGICWRSLMNFQIGVIRPSHQNVKRVSVLWCVYIGYINLWLLFCLLCCTCIWLQILNFWFLIDSENRLWFQPECTGSGSEDQVGPSPRAFHVAAAIDCHMFIFGGRFGSKRSVYMAYLYVCDYKLYVWHFESTYMLLMMRLDFQVRWLLGPRYR